MARYKVLKSVAHSLGHSFASTLNYDTSDYVMGHLLRRARETRQNRLVIDLMTGAAAPDLLLVPPVQRSVARFTAWLPDLVHRHFSDMKYVSAATMSVSFDISTERPNRLSPDCLESPFVIRVEIIDDRGKAWIAEQSDWWFPEPPRRPRSQSLDRFGWFATIRDRIRQRMLGGPLSLSSEPAA